MCDGMWRGTGAVGGARQLCWDRANAIDFTSVHATGVHAMLSLHCELLVHAPLSVKVCPEYRLLTDLEVFFSDLVHTRAGP